MDAVQAKFPHRDPQINLLRKLLCNKNAKENVHIFGLPATGKTAVVRLLLEESKTSHIYINCHEFSSTRRLFEGILLHISKMDQPSVDSPPTTKRLRGKPSKPCVAQPIEDHFDCRNGYEFTKKYDDLCLWKFQNHKQPTVLVLDNVECVRHYTDDDPLPILCQMYRCPSPLILATIGRLPWSKLFSGGHYSYPGSAPIQISFPNYSKEETADVLAKMKSGDGPIELGYREFLQHMLSIFYFQCRDVLELDYQIRPLWTANRGRSISKKSAWNEIDKSALQQLNGLFLRNSTSTAEMSQTAKYLLIAAFCASYNPMKTDKRFFMKHHGKEKLQSARVKGKSAYRYHCLITGPKAFPLERLLTIYRCIAKDNEKLVESAGVNIGDRLLSQIAGLVNDRLLQSISSMNMLSAPKYRCLSSLETVDELAKSVDIELKQRLFDFVNAV